MRRPPAGPAPARRTRSAAARRGPPGAGPRPSPPASSYCRRHAAQASTWAAIAARRPPSMSPSTRSTTSSPRCSVSHVVPPPPCPPVPRLSADGRPQPPQPRPDAGLGRAERDALALGRPPPPCTRRTPPARPRAPARAAACAAGRRRVPPRSAPPPRRPSRRGARRRRTSTAAGGRAARRRPASARRARTASMATLRVIVSNQAATEPRATSYVEADRHARRNASWATSSASVGVAGHGEREPEHLGLEPADERRGRVGVLDRQPGDERVVGQLGVVRRSTRRELRTRRTHGIARRESLRGPSCVLAVVLPSS